MAPLLVAEAANLQPEGETSTIMNPELPSLPNDPDDGMSFPQIGEAPDDEMDVEEEDFLGGAKPGECQEHVSYKDVCGVLVLQWFGFPCPFCQMVLSLAALNDMLSPLDVCLEVCHSKTVGVDGKYLCHQGNHFTGLKSSEGSTMAK